MANKERETNLLKLLNEHLPDCKHIGLGQQYSDFENSIYHDDLMQLYLNLGGIQSKYPCRFGSVDILLNNSIDVELDEEQHFNSYRLQCLKSEIYITNHFDFTNRYKDYCITKENACLSKAGRGGYWSNNSTEKQFGKSYEEKNFDNNVSSRWKQRAFYDTLRDVYALISGKKIIRISIYDTISLPNQKEIEIGTALSNKNCHIYKEVISNYVMGFKI